MDAPPLDPTPPVAPPPEAPPRRLGRWLKRIAATLILLVLLAVGAAAAVIHHFDQGLPKFDALTDYRPKQVTNIYCADGSLCGEFFHERRTVLPKEEIPDLLKKAVISAEDANFYNHAGLDYLHIAHALFKDMFHLGIRSGASTITQQVVKTFLLSPERKLSRKIREAILARRLEQNLSKDDILSLYLNQIYFGHHRYGIEEASQYYFGKSARLVTLGEAALLAGMPQSPNRLNPITSPTAAKTRQTYVLGQMAKNGYITPEQAQAEIARPISLAPRTPPLPGPYYLEEVRRQLEATYGDDRMYEGGLAVQIAMDPRRQQAADLAVDQGLRELDKRQGYRGPLAHLGTAASPHVAPASEPTTDEEADSPDDEDNDTLSATHGGALPATKTPLPIPAGLPPALTTLHQLLADRLSKGIPREPNARAIWDLSRVTPEIAEKGLGAVSTWTRVRVLEPGIRVGGVVSEVDDAKGRVVVDLGNAMAELHFDDLKWARPYDVLHKTSRPTKASVVLALGDAVLVQLGTTLPRDPKDPLPAVLDQDPLVQGALVSIDPTTRQVVAMVGGDDFSRSSFNRATQAHRQPGSSFKPYVYAAALASSKFTLATILNDAPYISHDPWTGKAWKPENFERDEYSGPITLRKALAVSSNVVAVRVIEAVGADAAIDLARRAGIASQIVKNNTIALGTAEVTPMEHANAYATFAAGGKRADPILVVKVADRTGHVLEQHQAEPTETIPPAVAFLVTQMMTSVVTEGTGARAQQLGRVVAAKTGTAQDQRDAWFCGFTPDLVTVTWVGFDDHDRLGYQETGAHAALPSWLYYMKAAEDGHPALDFAPPPGVVQVRIDPKSGLLAADAVSGRLEYFVDGTQPKETAPPQGQAPASDFFFEEQDHKP